MNVRRWLVAGNLRFSATHSFISSTRHQNKHVKRFINIIVVASLVIITACHAEKQLRLLPQEQRYENITEKLQAHICIDTIQKQSDKGLQFSIRITNDSSADISISNPLEFMGPVLSNDTGLNMMTEEIGRSLMHLAYGRKYHYSSFNIAAVKVNGKKSTNDLNAARTIIIPAKGVYDIFVSITKARKSRASEDVVLFPKGPLFIVDDTYFRYRYKPST
jgi:hypothetical protein